MVINGKNYKEHVQGGPDRSRQSNLAVFPVEGGLNSKFPCVKLDLWFCIGNTHLPFKYFNIQ